MNLLFICAGRLRWRIMLLSLLLIHTLALQAEERPDSDGSQAQTHSRDQIVKLPDFPSLDQFDEVIERTLFNASRKPGIKSSGLTGGNEKTLREAWKLTGITITNDLVLALFSERNGDKRLRLEVGMPLDDFWQLDQVEKDWVGLVSGNKNVRLELRQPRELLPVSEKESKAPAKGAQGSDPATSQRKANPTQGAVPQRGKVQEM